MPTKIQEWQEVGFSDKEIEEHLAKKTSEWRTAGFSDKEIDDYLGRKTFDPEGLEEILREVANRDGTDWAKEEDLGKGFLGAVGRTFGKFLEPLSFEELGRPAWPGGEGVIKPFSAQETDSVLGIGAAYELGVRGSVAGLQYWDKLPPTLPEEVWGAMPQSEKLFSQLGGLTGDLGYLLGGGWLSTMAALPTGPAAPWLGLAGGFGLTEGLRQFYIDKIEKGEIGSVKEFIHRLNDSLWATYKGLTVGAVTGAAGAKFKGFIPSLAAEIPTFVTIAALLENRFPEAGEFRDAAVLLTGLKGAGRGIRILKAHWVRTGENPSKVVERILNENQEAGRELPFLQYRDPSQTYTYRPRGVEELLGTKKFQKPKPFSGEPEPYGGPLTPEQRYQQLKGENEGITAREMRIQDIADEGIGKIQRWKAEDKPWNVRIELDRIVKEHQERRGPPKIEGIGKQTEKEFYKETVQAVRSKDSGRIYKGESHEVAAEKLVEAEGEGIDFDLGWDTRGFFTKQGKGIEAFDAFAQYKEQAKSTAVYSHDWDLGEGPVEYFKVKGGPHDGSDLSRAQVEELGIRIVREKGIVGDPEGIGKQGPKIEKYSLSETPEGIYIIPKGQAVPESEAVYGKHSFLLMKEETPRQFVVEEINVAKVMRRKGIATEMYQEAAKVVKQKGGELRFGKEGEITKWGKELRKGLEEKGIVDETGRVLDFLTSEDGFLDLGVFADGLRKIKDLGKALEKEAPYLLKYPYYSGKEGAKKLRELQSLLETPPWWEQQRNPVFKPYFWIKNLGDESRVEMNYKFLNKIDPFFKLRGKDWKDYKRITLTGDKANYEYETLKDYTEKTKDVVSEKAFEIYKLMQGTFKEADETRINLLRREGVDPEDLQSLMTEMGKIKGYFPRKRSGKYFLLAKKKGEPDVREHYNNEAQLQKLTKKWGEKGYVITESGEIPFVPEEMYSRMDVATLNAILDVAGDSWEPALRKQVFKDVSDVIKGRGFLAHGIKRGEELVLGFEEKNLKQVVIEYFTGLSGMLSKVEMAKKFREQFYEDFSEGKLSNKDKKLISKYITDMMSPKTGARNASAKIRALLFAKYMHGVVARGLVNLTGNEILGYPRLGMETKWPLAKHSAAIQDIINHTVGLGVGKGVEKLTGEKGTVPVEVLGKKIPFEEMLSPLKPEEIIDLRRSLQKGWTQDLYTQELMGSLGNLGAVGTLISKLLGGPMSVTEKLNRLSTQLAAYRVFRYEKGMGDLEASLAAKGVVLDSHGLYGYPNLPGVIRGSGVQDLARTAYTFRAYPHNEIHLFAKFAREDKIAIVRSLGMMLALGGIASLPFSGTINSFLSRWGVNPESELKKLMEEYDAGEMWELVDRGLPSLGGIDLSGSLSLGLPGEHAIGAEGIAGILGTAAVDVFGVPGQVVEDTLNAATQLYHGDLGRAIEEGPFTPSYVINQFAASRMEKEGLTTGKGNLIRDDQGAQIFLSPEEAWRKKWLGVQSPRMSEGYRTFTARRDEEARWERKKKKLEVAFKKAMSREDFDEVAKINEQIVALTTELPSFVAPIDISELWKSALPVLPPSGKEFLLQQEVR